jgi:hypothetical protein
VLVDLTVLAAKARCTETLAVVADAVPETFPTAFLLLLAVFAGETRLADAQATEALAVVVAIRSGWHGGRIGALGRSERESGGICAATSGWNYDAAIRSSSAGNTQTFALVAHTILAALVWARISLLL